MYVGVGVCVTYRHHATKLCGAVVVCVEACVEIGEKNRTLSWSLTILSDCSVLFLLIITSILLVKAACRVYSCRCEFLFFSSGEPLGEFEAQYAFFQYN